MKHHFAPLHFRLRAKGFSLLEVLISVAILSIGLLGLAGLQATTLRHNHSAYLRSQANLLVYDIVDRMRANRSIALNGNYNLALDADPATPEKDCTKAECEAAELAAYDLNNWIQNLAAALPAGDGEISQPAAATPGAITVTVQWDETWTRAENVENDDGTDPLIKQFAMSTEL